MKLVLTFLGLVALLFTSLTIGGYFKIVDRFYYSKWPVYETFEYVGTFLSVLKIYSFYIILFLTVEYQEAARAIFGYYYNSFVLWADIQFISLWTMLALFANMLYLMIREYRFLGRRKHSLISRTLRLTSYLITIHFYFLIFSTVHSTELGISGIYNIGVLILFGICTVLSTRIIYKPRLYFALLHLITISLLGAFSTYNLFYFYVFFEITLIPVFLMIIIWGSRDEKSSAAYQLFIYTLLGSLVFLVS